MADFNWVDYTILTILLLSVLAGFARGLIKEVLSVLTWVIAFVVSCLFASKLAGAFTSSETVQSAVTDASNAVGMNAAQPVSMLALGLSFVSIFLVILVIGSLVTYVISGAVEGVGLGFVNRLFGGIFGLARGFLINLMFIFIIQLTSYEQESWWKESKLVPYYQPAISWIANLVNPELNKLKDKANLENSAQTLLNNVYQYRG